MNIWLIFLIVFRLLKRLVCEQVNSTMFQLKEMHTIEIIGKNSNVTPSDIARELMLTLGTITTSLNKLEAKGYIERRRSKLDRRVVHLTLTKKGRLLDRLHHKFHKNMVSHIAEDMNEEELEALLRGLKNLHKFLEELM